MALAVIAAAACKDDLDDRVSILRAPRLLAVRADPAEVAPKGPTTLRGLYVDATGAVASTDIDWGFCNARKPLAELGPVSPECDAVASSAIVPIGRGGSVTTAMPEDACRQFGPDVPVPKTGESGARPVDPDVTGGYYQPLRIAGTNGDVSIERLRIACSLPGATAEQASAFARAYHANTNPEIDAVTIDGAGVAVDARAALSAGQRIALRVSWRDCSEDATACTGAETYARFDLASRSIVTSREAIRVAWYASAGAFDADRTGRDAADLATSSDNAYVAPSAPGSFVIWIVLRDDRGGASWRSVALDVR